MGKQKKETNYKTTVGLDREDVKVIADWGRSIGYEIYAGPKSQLGMLMLDLFLFAKQNQNCFIEWQNEQALLLGSAMAWGEKEGECYSKIAKAWYPKHDIKNGHCVRCGKNENAK